MLGYYGVIKNKIKDMQVNVWDTILQKYQQSMFLWSYSLYISKCLTDNIIAEQIIVLLQVAKITNLYTKWKCHQIFHTFQNLLTRCDYDKADNGDGGNLIRKYINYRYDYDFSFKICWLFNMFHDHFSDKHKYRGRY